MGLLNSIVEAVCDVWPSRNEPEGHDTHIYHSWWHQNREENTSDATLENITGRSRHHALSQFVLQSALDAEPRALLLGSHLP
jgi:hypothetical protein